MREKSSPSSSTHTIYLEFALQRKTDKQVTTWSPAPKCFLTEKLKDRKMPVLKENRKFIIFLIVEKES